MWGSSTHNTRIERMWVEVGCFLGRSWRGFFTHLSRLHLLDRTEPAHLWLLQTLFLGDIERDCDQFRSTWNKHPISKIGNNLCPDDLRLLGQTAHGIIDPSDNLTLEELYTYYGTTYSKLSRRSGESGAGHDDAEENEPVEIARSAKIIGIGQENQVRHPPAMVPRASCPFESMEDIHLFWDALDIIRARKSIPQGFMLDKLYESTETFSTGRCKNGLTVPLDYEVWYPRILLWCQALDLLKQFHLVVKRI